MGAWRWRSILFPDNQRGWTCSANRLACPRRAGPSASLPVHEWQKRHFGLCRHVIASIPPCPSDPSVNSLFPSCWAVLSRTDERQHDSSIMARDRRGPQAVSRLLYRSTAFRVSRTCPRVILLPVGPSLSAWLSLKTTVSTRRARKSCLARNGPQPHILVVFVASWCRRSFSGQYSAIITMEPLAWACACGGGRPWAGPRRPGSGGGSPGRHLKAAAPSGACGMGPGASSSPFLPPFPF